MVITWYGQSCFKIQDRQQTILSDPYSPRKYGLRGPHIKATLILLTDPDDEKIVKKNLKQECFLIHSPGEYEIKDIIIYGIVFSSKEKQIIVYHLEISGIRFGILGEIDHMLNDKQLERLDGIDVLFVPVGEKNLLNSKGAIDIINSLEPRFVIPSCFKIPKLKINLSPVDTFLKEMGIKKVEKVDKLLLHKKYLSQEQTKIVVLEPKG